MSSGQECRGGFYNTPQNAIFCDRKKNSTLFCCFSTPRPLILGLWGLLPLEIARPFWVFPWVLDGFDTFLGRTVIFAPQIVDFLLYIALLHDGFQVLWELEY